jgi:hypothetical protein
MQALGWVLIGVSLGLILGFWWLEEDLFFMFKQLRKF